MDSRKKLQEAYDELGAFAIPYAVDQKRFRVSLEILITHDLIRGKRILDLGCGIGIMALALAKAGAEVVGADMFIFPDAFDSPYKVGDIEALKQIWKRNGVTVVNHDILQRLPFPDGEFDVVICDATVEHLLHSPKGMFADVHRVLKSDGAFLVSTPNLAKLIQRFRFFLGRSPNWDIRDYFNDGSHFTGHRREFTVRELRQMLEMSSFTVEEAATANVYFNPKRLLSPEKSLGQIFSILSLPFSGAREMLYVLSEKS